MRISNRLDFRHCSRSADVTNRTAVYGSVRTVVWQGSVGDRRPYADLTGKPDVNWSKAQLIVTNPLSL